MSARLRLREHWRAADERRRAYPGHVWGRVTVHVELVGANPRRVIAPPCWECGERMTDVLVHLREESGEELNCPGIGPSCSCWLVLLDVRFGFCAECARYCALGVLNAAKMLALADLSPAGIGAAARRDGIGRLRNALPIALERHLGADRRTVARVRAALSRTTRERVKGSVMTSIEELLQEVARTGELPDGGEITSVMRRGRAAEREGARRGLRIAAKKIIAGADPEAVIEEATAKYGNVAGGGPEATESRGRELAAQVVANRDRGDIELRRAEAREAVRRREPIIDVLLSGVRAGGVDPGDLDAFRLAERLSDDQRRDWRLRATAAGERVSRVFREGDQGGARQLARILADDLAGDLAPVARRDPLRDEADPRALADAVIRRSAGIVE
jgi:hypothetical protein